MSDGLFPLPEAVEPDPNPCVHAFGIGPERKRCGTCSHLTRSWGRWFKCGFRRRSSCSATDHRSRWDACGKYEEDTTNE